MSAENKPARPTEAEIDAQMARIDGVNGAAGHELTDPVSRAILRRQAAGEITGDEARAQLLAHGRERTAAAKVESCELGMTVYALQALLGDRLPEFEKWIRGQTMGECPEHGRVVYRIDLERFLSKSRMAFD